MTVTLNQTARPTEGARPTRDDLIDGAMLLVLGALALAGFRSTYSGSTYLVVGVAGLLLGIVTAYIANSLRQPLIVLAVMGIAVFFLVGAALVVRSEAAAGILPTPAATRSLATASIDGWKQLVTTQPPVGRGGTLLAVPYLMGLLGGVVGFAIARRTRVAVGPVFAPLAMLAGVILLGTLQPAAVVVQGAIFAMVGVSWIALRGQRLQPRLRNDAGRRSRIVVAGGLVGTTALIAAIVGPAWLEPGHERVVLRTYVDPPVDISEYPSPLAGFRKFRGDLETRPLLEVQGLPKGTYVRIATLDSYDGSVWGATNDGSRAAPDAPKNQFVRVGAAQQTDGSGPSATIRVKVLRDYAAATDLNPWLPATGGARTVGFTGGDAKAHDEALVVNEASGQALVTDRLQPGDTYTLHVTIGTGDRAKSDLAPAAQPFGPPSPAIKSALTASKVTKWSAGATTPVGRLTRVADNLRKEGAYSDGKGDQAYFLPGHGAGRLSREFLNDSQPTGDDEQYAAAFALMAKQLGVPARVVLGAQPQSNGIVEGKDIHAWVEVHLVNGWVSIPATRFMDRNKVPDTKRQQQTPDSSAAAPVPPPSPVRPRTAIDDGTTDGGLSQLSHGARADAGWTLPWYVGATLRVVMPPLLVVGLVAGGILGIKARRRNRRRTAGPVTTRVAEGWNELVDCARDYGTVMPLGRTRQEQAASLPVMASGLARSADATVFGPGEPADSTAEEYWRDVDEARAAIGADATRWTRLRAALSLRSLRADTGTRPVGASA